jgi:hypothetical protein
MEKEEDLVMLDRALGERAAALLSDPAAPPALLASHHIRSCSSRETCAGICWNRSQQTSKHSCGVARSQ